MSTRKRMILTLDDDLYNKLKECSSLLGIPPATYVYQFIKKHERKIATLITEIKRNRKKEQFIISSKYSNAVALNAFELFLNVRSYKHVKNVLGIRPDTLKSFICKIVHFVITDKTKPNPFIGLIYADIYKKHNLFLHSEFWLKQIDILKNLS